MLKFKGSAKDKLALECLVKLSRASDALMQATSRHFKNFELTESQFGVLEMLLHLGPLSQCQIAKKHLKTPGNITHIIDNLEQAKLVARISKPEDRRTKIIILTELGEKKIKEVFPVHVKEISNALSVLSKEEQEQLASLCKKLGTNLMNNKI
jgi:MarR family 2-MHQ and catechol resistance regulon transcriptional repressor